MPRLRPLLDQQAGTNRALKTCELGRRCLLASSYHPLNLPRYRGTPRPLEECKEDSRTPGCRVQTARGMWNPARLSYRITGPSPWMAGCSSPKPELANRFPTFNLRAELPSRAAVFGRPGGEALGRFGSTLGSIRPWLGLVGTLHPRLSR